MSSSSSPNDRTTRGRSLPGTRDVPGRSFVYVEQQGDTGSFLDTFRSLGDFIEAEGERYPRGGMITENVRVTIGDGRVFYGISFKGDTDRWWAGIRRFVLAKGLGLATVEGSRFVVEGTESFDVPEVTVEYLSKP